MADRLPDALRYFREGFWPIPCRPGTKDASLVKWSRYQRQGPSHHDLHCWWTGERTNNNNVALVLGPSAHLLALNVQVKYGKDGLANLRRFSPLATPHIITPSGGLAYFFRPSDPQRYPSPFGTYVYPDDPPGFESLELRGAGGIQLVPSSCVDGKPYRFAAPWTPLLARDLAHLPDWLLELWITLDARAQNRPEISDERARNSGHVRTAASAQVQTTDLSQPTAQPRLISPPTSATNSSPVTSTPATHSPPMPTTITTVLTPEEIEEFAPEAFDEREPECAAYVNRLAGLDDVFLHNGLPFCCRLPGHIERNPSASWVYTQHGHYLYKDWHVRSKRLHWPVPDVFAALITRELQLLPKPSRKTWRLRLMIAAGLLEPYPVPMCPTPLEAPRIVHQLCAGFEHLLEYKWHHCPNTATQFSQNFAARWCGIPRGSVAYTLSLAMRMDLIVYAGREFGAPVYRPGKDE
jgi:Bifunctional DNA primase/polymerase, N-terminal